MRTLKARNIQPPLRVLRAIQWGVEHLNTGGLDSTSVLLSKQHLIYFLRLKVEKGRLQNIERPPRGMKTVKKENENRN